YFALLRWRRVAHSRDARAIRAGPGPHVCAPQADRRRRIDYAVEFSERDPGVEARAGTDLREYGGVEARVGRAPERVADRRGAARSGDSERCGEFRGWLGRRIGTSAGQREAAEGDLVYGVVRDRQLAA